MSIQEKICPQCNKCFRKRTKYCCAACFHAAPVSEETRLKRSLKTKGCPKSNEVKIKISQATKGKAKFWARGEGNPNFRGKCINKPEVRDKFLLAVKRRGQPWTDDHKKNQSILMTGTTNSFYGKKHKKKTKKNYFRFEKETISRRYNKIFFKQNI